VAVRGDRAHPLTAGYLCAAGRALPAMHTDPSRLIRSLKRDRDGSLRPIASERAMDEIAATMSSLLGRYGPRALAFAPGTGIGRVPAAMPVGMALWSAIGSPMVFTPATIDQPGKVIAAAYHGRWGGHVPPIRSADVWMFVGANPVVSMWAGGFLHHPTRVLRDARERGATIIVVDPRRTETAVLADEHVQLHPGQDPVLLAGLVRMILRSNTYDRAFCTNHVSGVEELRAAVEPFTPEVVEARAGVPVGQLERVAALLTSTKRGGIEAGTGPNMAPRGALAEYLVLCLRSLCGYWNHVGDVVPNPGVLTAPREWRAEAQFDAGALDKGAPSRIRDLPSTSLGMPTAAAADEMLVDGDGRVRSLLCMGSNPITAWPDQDKTYAALRSLELLVTIDPVLSASARIAHYVIAPPLSLETPGMTLGTERLTEYGATAVGFDEPFAMYAPVVADPPPAADLISESDFCFGVAARLGIDLVVDGITLDPRHPPRDEELFALMTRDARVPLAEVQSHSRGACFPTSTVVLPPRDPSRPSRLQVGHPAMTGQLDELAREGREEGLAHFDLERHRFRLLCRRTRQFKNSSGRTLAELHRGSPFNPAFMHPMDLAALGVRPGDIVEIDSRYGAIAAVARAAEDVLPGTISMAHGFGGLPDDHLDPRQAGANTGRLLTTEEGFDAISGQPVMTAVPVSVRLAAAPSDRGTQSES
jgi:anaerobic selenocysteine-containing dehydrogenase